MKIKKNEDRITKLLTNKPELRDDDMRLLANVWYQECNEQGFNTLKNTQEFLKYMSLGKLSNPSSIRRCRAKVQELNEHLRGATYETRQTKRKDNVATEIRGWNKP